MDGAFAFGDGFPNLFAEEMAEAAAGAVDSDFDAGFRHAERDGDVGVGHGLGCGGEVLAKGFEGDGLAGFGEFLAQFFESGIEGGAGPLAFEGQFGVVGAGGFETVARIGGGEVEREYGEIAATLLGVVAGAFGGEVVLRGGQQEGTKAAVFGTDGIEGVEVEETGEEALGEILGVGGLAGAAADEGVDGIPVDGEEALERVVGVGGFDALGGEDDAPLRGRKTAGSGHSVILIFAHASGTSASRGPARRAVGPRYKDPRKATRSDFSWAVRPMWNRAS